MTTENPTYWSDNEEDWNCDCLSDLLAGNDELKAGDTVYFGTGVTPPASAFISADEVLEMMGERAYDNFGEHAEDFPDVTAEAKAELEAMLSDWVGRHCHPTFYRITDVTEYVLTEEDIQDASRLTPHAAGDRHAAHRQGYSGVRGVVDSSAVPRAVRGREGSDAECVGGVAAGVGGSAAKAILSSGVPSQPRIAGQERDVAGVPRRHRSSLRNGEGVSMSLWQSFKRLPEQEQKRQFEILAKSDMQRIRMEVWIEEEGERTNVCVKGVIGKRCSYCGCRELEG